VTILLDFESRSRVDLTEIGGRNYWAHASTEPLCCGWYDTRTQEAGCWAPGDEWPHRGRTLAAHNMTFFDRFGAERLGWLRPGERWIDTSELARCMGLPGSLDALGTRLAGREKDAEGSRFTKSLSQIRRPSGKKNPAAIAAATWRELSKDERAYFGVQTEVTPEVMARVQAYCMSDVEIMIEAWPLLESWHELEPEVQAVDRAINDRGVRFDSHLARALIACAERNADTELARIARALGTSASAVRATANSPAQFVEVTGLPDAQADTVHDFLLVPVVHDAAHMQRERALLYCQARQAVASIAAGKLRAGLACVSPDGRLRDMHRYYGAHTGRWSGKDMQLQNLPRPDKRFEKMTADELEALAVAVCNGRHYASADEIDLLLRAVLCASPGNTLAVCDFSGVEARGLAWLSNDTAALEVFAAGRDPYKVMAATIFSCSYDAVDKIQRGIGKIAVLACGYGMGADKFDATAAEGGVDLAAAGVDAQDVVQAWRRAHAPSVQFWYACERAFVDACRGERRVVSHVTFEPSSDGKDVAIFLPSGRPIVYNDVRLSMRGSPRGPKPCPTYLGTRGRKHLYGGLIVENITQSMCRDPMAQTLVAAEEMGLDPVLHVHDEGACDVPAIAGREAYDLLRQIMIDKLQSSMPGFPAGAEGFTGRRYRK
jgi:DNA polymerase bacteriophage-type